MKTVIFLCPHAAAKSVIAAAYFNRIAQTQGLDWQATAAGTEPQAAVSPAVVKLLAEEGLDVSQHQPRRITTEELNTAQRVISLGCRIEDIALDPEKIDDWSDIPAPSIDLQKTRAMIAQSLEALMLELQD